MEPQWMTELKQTEIFDYLDGLRSNGLTNRFKMYSLLMEEFDIVKPVAMRWIGKWSRSHGIDHIHNTF